MFYNANIQQKFNIFFNYNYMQQATVQYTLFGVLCH